MGVNNNLSRKENDIQIPQIHEWSKPNNNQIMQACLADKLLQYNNHQPH